MKKRNKEALIEESHKFREALLGAIQVCDQQLVEKYTTEMVQYLHHDILDIFKRIPGDKLRSFKNFLFSHNTLYSYAAEKGGLSALHSHYMTEKYAILIEHTMSIYKLEEIHLNMLRDYADPNNRLFSNDNLSVAGRAAKYITINFNENITIEEIAKKLHVHPAYLMRTFKKEKGLTVSQFRRVKRIKEAKELLRHSNLNLTDIAFMVGFNNSQYFSRAFKEEAGVTPKEFRINHHE
jgi:AraC-like DNA-binding protein